MIATSPVFEQLRAFVRETSLLSAAESALAWDERTNLPPAAGEYRAEQLTLLSGVVHRRKTDPLYGEWLAVLGAAVEGDPHAPENTVVRQLKREYDKRIKLPQSLVEELTRTASLAQHAWEQARAQNDFAGFLPYLQKMFELKRAQATAIGFTDSPYDPLLDDFEPEERTVNVRRVLAQLREALVPLVAAIRESGRRPDVSLLRRHYPRDAQEAFGKAAAAAIGFDFRRGRLDVTSHPFCTGLGPNDCRITTRYDEHFLPSAFFGILHEAGHGIYDQGLPGDWYGLPPGEAVSLGIHESQSRMWENLVGRSHAFWEYCFPLAQQAFPQALSDVPLDTFYFAVNDVQPSLIRVEADEATYNLHILIRFELEQALLSGELAAADLPGAWGEKCQAYLGIQPPTDASGVMQDIHWSAGLVGYFPTYTLGNLYAAQFFKTADAELGGLNGAFRRGEFAALRDWLRQKIHRHGQCYTAAELVRNITGQPLSHAPLIEHLRAKFGPLYGL